MLVPSQGRLKLYQRWDRRANLLTPTIVSNDTTTDTTADTT